MKKHWCFVSLALLAIGCAPPQEEFEDTRSSSSSADTDCVTCALRSDGHVVIEDVPDAEHLERLVREIPDGGWRVGNTYYAQVSSTGRTYFKSWLYLIEITAWQHAAGTIRPHRGRIVGSRPRASADWRFADNLVAPSTSTAVVLGTWEDEAKNALSMKWIPSELPLGAVVLPSKQTLVSNFLNTGPLTQGVAYGGLIACVNKLANPSVPIATFDDASECDDAREDRDRVLDTYRAEMGGSSPSLVIGISAGTVVAQQLGQKLGDVETHLFGTPRYACKADNKVACNDGDAYVSQDSAEPYCENGPDLVANAFYRNNPHDRVPGAFFNTGQIGDLKLDWLNTKIDFSNPWHDYSNWTYSDTAGAQRFHRTTYESCSYPVNTGGHPDCAHFPFTFGTCK